jgi:hypothetical protein
MAPWWDGLDAATLRRLRDRYPGLSFEEMAVHALRLPAYADDFADLGAQVMSVPDVDHIGTRREDHEPTEVAWFPFNTEQAGRALLVMALLAALSRLRRMTSSVVSPTRRRPTQRPGSSMRRTS